MALQTGRERSCAYPDVVAPRWPIVVVISGSGLCPISCRSTVYPRCEFQRNFCAKSRVFSLRRHAFSSYVSHECLSSSSVLYRDTPCYIRQRNLCHPELVDQQMHGRAHAEVRAQHLWKDSNLKGMLVNCRDKLMASVRTSRDRHKISSWFSFLRFAVVLSLPFFLPPSFSSPPSSPPLTMRFALAALALLPTAFGMPPALGSLHGNVG